MAATTGATLRQYAGVDIPDDVLGRCCIEVAKADTGGLAIRWVARARPRGDLSPDKRGGNVRSHRIDEHRDLILDWIEEKLDLTLAEVAERLDESVGTQVTVGGRRVRSLHRLQLDSFHCEAWSSLE
ncbi:hypothetical protein ABNQ39_36375 (plasmid) [Azospirillum sp. A26]|uniref:hypothetical protein n=1 Tax=Azospirillum sp. A26 TaxID=3160607 RepID=UPI003672E4F1